MMSDVGVRVDITAQIFFSIVEKLANKQFLNIF
jgi:hypothetical protein